MAEITKTFDVSGFVRSKYRKITTADGVARVKLLMRAVLDYGVILPVMGTLGLLTFGVLRVLRPLVKVRVGKLGHERIGHLSGNTELFLRRQTVRKDSDREFYVFVSGEPANRQLLTMIKRRLTVIENHFAIWAHKSVRMLINNSDLWIDLPFRVNEYNEFDNIAPQLTFTEEEETRGWKVLASMGIQPGTQFVCFHARDKTYLDAKHSYRSREEWAYHDHRDCDIANYLSAANYLVQRGCFSLRMGHTVEKRLPASRHNKVVDYASDFRSDFADIYLIAHCKFFLGNDSGPWVLATCFDVPVANANLIPLQTPPLTSKGLFITKKLWDVARKRFLTFHEILGRGIDSWLYSRQFTQAGIEVIENTSEEILALTKEMDERLDGTWAGTEEDEELQQRFRAFFPLGHRCYGFPSKIGAEFLRENSELLD